MTLSERILKYLGDEGIPTPTPLIVERFFKGRPHARQQAWSYLRSLQKVGLIVGDRRNIKSEEGDRRAPRITYWRLK